MQPVPLDKLDLAAFDDAVMQTQDIDHFCSGSDWILPAYHAFAGDLKPHITASEYGYAAFVEGDDAGSLLPLDTVWGFACPLLGPKPAPLLHDFVRTNRAAKIVLTGMHRQSEMFAEVVKVFSKSAKLYLGNDPARRCAISLGAGLDAYLARRSRNFRHSLKQAERRARSSHITFEFVDRDCFERILQIESQSWKGQLRVGIDAGDMRHFYQLMCAQLQTHNRLQVLFAKQGERDVGYLLGAYFANSYRGLQFSYAEDVERLGIGNLLQWIQMQKLVELGVTVYDMGMDMPYKRRFADGVFQTETLIIFT
jgi:hypothetical protein